MREFREGLLSPVRQLTMAHDILYEMRLFLTFFVYEHVKWFQKAKLCNVLADRG